MVLLRTALAGLLIGGGMLVGATSAAAAPPSNDTIAGATVIAALPFVDTVDTTEATTDADELAAAQPCLDFGAPAIEHAVWYTATAQTDGAVTVDVTASDYSAGIAVYLGFPSAGTFITCAPGTLTGSATAGQTFYLMIFGDEVGSAGGTLTISVTAAVLPEVALSVDPVGHFDPGTGAMTVTGTASCGGDDVSFAGIEGTVRQAVGRFVVLGSFFLGLTCDGVTHTWAAEVLPQNGRFAGGSATVEATAFACGPAGCSEDHVDQRIRVRR